MNIAKKSVYFKTTMAERKCHCSFTPEQIKKKRHEATPESTLKCNKKWDKVFRAYLEEKEFENTEYWCYPDDELDTVLSQMWFEIRSKNTDEQGEFIPYTVTSLRNMRNALTRELNNHGRFVDLTTDPHFKQSQTAFKDACKELKEMGRAVVRHYPEITHAGNHNFILFHTISTLYYTN